MMHKTMGKVLKSLWDMLYVAYLRKLVRFLREKNARDKKEEIMINISSVTWPELAEKSEHVLAIEPSSVQDKCL